MIRFSVRPRRPYSLVLTAARYARFPEVVDRFDGRTYRRLLRPGRGAVLLSVAQRGGPDRASLEVRWSAAINDQPPENHRHVFVLGRAAAARSKRGLSSLDCPNCGGPLANSDEVTCRYCNTALTGGKLEWALLEVSERPKES